MSAKTQCRKMALWAMSVTPSVETFLFAEYVAIMRHRFLEEMSHSTLAASTDVDSDWFSALQAGILPQKESSILKTKLENLFPITYDEFNAQFPNLLMSLVNLRDDWNSQDNIHSHSSDGVF